MTATLETSTIRGERALAEGDIDQLGFKEVALRIATSLVDHASDGGFVIGLDGRWGSGKSSLLYLISDELKRLPLERRPSIISFSPWLIGNRDALLNTLFNQLADATAAVSLAQGDATAETKRRAAEVAEKVRKFAETVTKAGDFIQAVPGGGTAGKIISGLNKLLRKGASPDLPRQKSVLTTALRDLKHRFLVTIDDVDRLEPAEVVEVLRLIRSVADFPNVIYLLCYDSAILAESVQRGANVSDGASYLEKIVQLSIMVPQPEPFQLRQWFGDEVLHIVGSVSDEQARRLRSVIDHEGGKRLLTPRAVVRSLDSFRFFWPALKAEGADLPDLVWLLLIKDGAPNLYRWIETYLGSAAIVATGIGSVSDSGKARELEELKKLIGAGHLDDLAYRHSFGEQLPGVEIDYGTDGDGLKLYQKISTSERDAAIAGRRLASPDHYRLYLALVGPGHAITQHQADDLWEATRQSPAQVGRALKLLAQQSISPEMTKADLLLERLASAKTDTYAPEQAANLLLAFSNEMDGFDKAGSDQSFMLFTTWDRAEQLVGPLLRRLDAEAQVALIDKMFRTGNAIGWLSSILRRETFAHGRYGDQHRPEQEWFFDEAEYDRVATIMVERYRQLSLRELLDQSRPLNVLFAWAQAGDPEGPSELISNSIKDDGGLIAVLAVFITTVNSSDKGTYEVISKDSLKRFVDSDGIIDRAGAVDPENLPNEMKPQLGRIKTAIENGRDRHVD